MITLRCLFGMMAPPSLIPGWLADGRHAIADFFYHASGDQISLDTTPARQSISRPNGQTQMTAGELQDALATLTTGNTPASVQSIGVILTDTFAGHPGTLGIMFDPGPGFAGLPQGNGIPREGCAIFLRAIQNLRQNSPRSANEPMATAFEAESFYTTVHELGHVFNLWHFEDGSNYMRTSGFDPTAPRSDAGFISTHRDFLATASRYVCPGKTSFGDRGPLQPTDIDLHNIGPVPWPDIRLEVRLTSHEFFAFEPVELEVTIHPARRSPSPVLIPDTVDPGYTGIKVFIEEPDGQRRLLRSPRRYCATAATIPISHQSPFHRDVSIFGDADGFTFRQPGPHKVWMEIVSQDGRIFRSNDQHCRILSYWDDRKRFGRLAPLLGRRDVASFLYRRGGDFRSTAARRLAHAAAHLLRTEPKLAKEIHYALGRARHSLATRRRLPNHQKEAERHFDRATRGTDLSTHRRRRIQQLSPC